LSVHRKGLRVLRMWLRVLSRLRGSLPQRTLPALQLAIARCGQVPGAPALRERPAAPCHPQLPDRRDATADPSASPFLISFSSAARRMRS